MTVIHTPGHSPGHCCFYEPERRYLYSGDLIYLGCLDAFYPTTNPVQFYQSVKRVEALTVDRILPAHHQLAVPADIVGKVSKAFGEIEKNGQLTQGAGLFDFGDFQIHI
ncbi:MBL fold metallo-hydrolase [Frisingicoccus sp.]|uniref:MBL fold metallo-hydrolase n=1 Tax=Frisingicoccus sp. TaxID=1918627 RepID=UPI003AB1A025